MNQLYYGDNLQVLREHIASESVDLIYLDPPFNSKRDYNLLFKSPKGHQSEAQIEAFKDSWSWGMQAEHELHELMGQKNTNVALVMDALRSFLGRNDMLAYLVMMTNRLLELHRVLKPTGSLYLHCDPSASHYLKLVLDAVFGKENYRTEVSWKRQSAHNDAKQGRQQYGNIRDVIFFYTKSAKWTWHWLYTPYDESYVEDFYRFVEPETGKRYRLSDITAPGGASPEKRNPRYEFLGVTRYWRYAKETMTKLHAEGRIVQTAPGRVPAYKRYLDEMPGVGLQNDWSDLKPVSGNESLGYPTQKPLALLERILSASSNRGDMVLDPFCGCGTAVHAAQKLKRKWIGIDITHLAISLIEKRLKDAFKSGCDFDVHGTPQDLAAARDLAERDKYQFQYWAVSLVNAQPAQGRKKGADGGVDGLKFFHDVDKDGARKIVVSVKGGGLKTDDVRALNHVREREQAEIALFITLETPTKGMIADAASAGFYTSAANHKVARVQLLTIESLLSGKQRAEHPDYAPDLNFKKAKVEATGEQKELL
ncbi:MAG: DNA methylase N-4/N-6 [Limisphaerales bacterium]|nr:MAG: DNA methylase N-4/N-6 [Limisphaerales bacterium]KAG0508612.1 MAG: DNA methylase N-4/N-6 [Limisphaerales bacterium]TXT48053.1 MAG: DNA methylase N-4/N-6 [Limisphaerales bacterium]